MAERSLRLLSRLPRPVFPARERRALLARADSIVAITRYEASLVRALIGDDARVCVIPNGVDLVTPAEQPPVDVVGAVLLLGGVSERKRQAGVIEALDGVARVVVAGGWSGGEDALRNFERVVAKAGATWLGEVRDPSAVAALQRDALALALMSRAEVQSLAVLEALAAGTPVLLSDIPSHRELAAAFPGSVYLISELSDLAAAVAAIRSAGQPPRPVLPSWRVVAVQLVAVYRSVVAT